MIEHMLKLKRTLANRQRVCKHKLKGRMVGGKTVGDVGIVLDDNTVGK